MEIKDSAPLLRSLSRSAHINASRTLSQVVAGSNEIITSPVGRDVPDGEILDSINSILESCDLTEKLLQIEDANRSSFGPRSRSIPWSERRQSLLDYFNHSGRSSVPSFESLDRISNVLSPHRGRLRTAGFDRVYNSLDKTTSSGLPLLQRKGAIKETTVRDFYERSPDAASQMPAMLYTRTQGGISNKTRNVWGISLEQILFEQRYFIPFLAAEKTLPFRSAINGPQHVNKAITSLLDGKEDKEKVVCIDFSAYDASISPKLLSDVMASIATTFQNRDEFLRYNAGIVDVGILCPDGIYSGNHGVPSGSSWTNTVDSLAQYHLSKSEPTKCQIQGDDGVYLTLHPEELYSRFEEGGLRVNKEKSDLFESKEAVYLQLYYSDKYRNPQTGIIDGIYSLYRAMCRIKYLERWTNFERYGISGEDFFSIRTLMILENCKAHPGFHQFVDYVLTLAPGGLSYSQEGIVQYAQGYNSKVRAGIKNQYGDEVLGLANFEVIKYINSKYS